MDVEEGRSRLEGWQPFSMQSCQAVKTHQGLVLAVAVQFRASRINVFLLMCNVSYQVKHSSRHLTVTSLKHFYILNVNYYYFLNSINNFPSFGSLGKFLLVVFTNVLSDRLDNYENKAH